MFCIFCINIFKGAPIGLPHAVLYRYYDVGPIVQRALLFARRVSPDSDDSGFEMNEFRLYRAPPPAIWRRRRFESVPITNSCRGSSTSSLVLVA